MPSTSISVLIAFAVEAQRKIESTKLVYSRKHLGSRTNLTSGFFCITVRPAMLGRGRPAKHKALPRHWLSRFVGPATFSWTNVCSDAHAIEFGLPRSIDLPTPQPARARSSYNVRRFLLIAAAVSLLKFEPGKQFCRFYFPLVVGRDAVKSNE
jgi:hypothetical protein